jgi:hypothetical protein
MSMTGTFARRTTCRTEEEPRRLLTALPTKANSEMVGGTEEASTHKPMVVLKAEMNGTVTRLFQ